MDIKQIQELVKLINKSNIGELSIEIIRFADGTAVVPQDRRSYDLIIAIEKDGGMHLAGETDRLNIAPRAGRPGPQLVEDRKRRAPPVFGILF